MEQITNHAEAFPEIVKFCKKYFENVKIKKNKSSHLAKISQNFYTILLFDNRGETFSIKWNYGYCTLYFGDITKNEKTCLQYTFTKMKYDYCYPIEEMNNSNVMFWMYEIVHPFDDFGNRQISPLRIPITLRS